MVAIQNIIVEEPVLRINFACDLAACKGACCTMPGGKGAPLLDEEIEPLTRYFPVIRSSLPKEHLEKIERGGLYEGSPGDYTTMCFENRACVFVFYENGIAKCAFEKAYRAGVIPWRKPLSCHLFPIRVDRQNGTLLRYERIAECEPALVRGSRGNTPLVQFVADALRRGFGESWYGELLRITGTAPSPWDPSKSRV